MRRNLLEKHFKNDFLAAFAYGSGVFKQQTHHRAEMIDFLLLVQDEDWAPWHRRNMLRNPQDYPAFAPLSLSVFAPGTIYFVPSVKVPRENCKIKYGVVRLNDLRRDLLTWSQLYVAGRLHKPTLFIPNQEIDGIHAAMQQNYSFALSVSMLLNSGTIRKQQHQLDFDFKNILKQIVGLSYVGDPRPEAPGKVESIVNGQFTELEAIYLERFEHLKRHLQGFDAVEKKMALLQQTPATFLSHLWTPRARNTRELALSCKESDFSGAVRQIVGKAAWRQMLLGAISCRPSVSLSYALSKIKKSKSLY
jgi:hypothetical protein